jgi:hypothetical protein
MKHVWKRTGLTAVAVLIAMLAMVYRADAASGVTVPVSGSGSGATFTGTYQIQKFVLQQGQVYASGVLSGTVTTATGVVTSVVQTVLMPVTVHQSSCSILTLDIGPISINLLGLQINLSQIVLTITAQSGSGDLLGNLLCAVANVLNNPSQLVNLLNQILALL